MRELASHFGRAADIGSRRLLRWTVVGVLLALILYAPGLPASQWAYVISNAAHGVVFAFIAPIVAVELMVAGRSRGRPYVVDYLAALATALLFGGTTELLQIPLARDASVYDLANDMFGAWLGLACLAFFDRRLRLAVRISAPVSAVIPVAILAAPIVACAVAYAERDAAFPAIADFRHSNLYFIDGVAAELEVGPLPDAWSPSQSRSESASNADSDRTLRVEFEMAQWSGVDLREPVPDWRGYRELALDLTNPNDSTLEVNLRVHDALHNFTFGDRFNTTLQLDPGSRAVFRVPLTAIAKAPESRAMDMSRIADLMLFVSREEGEHAPGGLYVSRIWLE